MSQRNSSKKNTTVGVKALIAAASVAATLTGWALLPGNDPQPATAANSQPALDVPSNSNNAPGSLTLPGGGDLPNTNTQPGSGSNLPQVDPFGGFNAPQGSSNFPMPFTRSHSSR